MKRLLLLCLVLAWSITASTSARAQQLDEVLARHYDAMGGLEQMKALQAVKMTGKAAMPAQGVELDIVVYQARPNLFRLDQEFDGTLLVQAYDGTTAWVVNPFLGQEGPVKVPDEQTPAMAAMSDFDGPLYDYDAKGHTLELVGREEVDGRPAYRIDVTLQSGEQHVFYLDAERYVTLKRVFTTTLNGQEIETAQVFGDYRPVGGVLIPHRVETKLDGQTISQVSIDSVEVNPEIDRSLFSMEGSP